MKASARLKASRSLVVVLFAAAFAACAGSGTYGVSCGGAGVKVRSTPDASAHPIPIGQLPPIDVDAVLAHTKVLSSNEYEGRAPGTKGEELTVRYIEDQFKKIGLKAGNA